MGQVYNFQDPLPLIFASRQDIVQEPDEDIVQAYNDDLWPDPGPCIICGTPHTACTGEEDWNN